MVCAAYALMHFLVDYVCAWAMFARFLYWEDAYFQLLVYNFCAFALQMPFGTLLDSLMLRRDPRNARWLPLCWTGVGVVLTVIGAFTAPWVLGCGNALFHVGGGTDVIREDFSAGSRGQQLGIFVAPGAIGLYFGTMWGQSDGSLLISLCSCVILVMLSVLLAFLKYKCKSLHYSGKTAIVQKNLPGILLCCFLVVVLRSVTGFYVSFPWKGEPVLSLLWVIAVAMGKLAGGIASARAGMKTAVILSLSLSGLCFLMGDFPVFGLAAIFLFNMTMPITLYLLVCQIPDLPGFSFGLLTFGLFLGFLPRYGGMALPGSASVIGMLGSFLSLILLLLCGRALKNGRVFS